MNGNLIGQAFEVGVKSALELLRDANVQQLRQQLAGSAQTLTRWPPGTGASLVRPCIFVPARGGSTGGWRRARHDFFRPRSTSSISVASPWLPCDPTKP